MTETKSPTGSSKSATGQMYELLDATEENVVAIRMHEGTREGYQELYEMLVEKTTEHGSIHVYEETPDWTGWTFLTHATGIVPDIRYGQDFQIKRYAAVGNSRWAKLLFDWWKIIRPIWPVAPEEMRYFEPNDREDALRGVKRGDGS